MPKPTQAKTVLVIGGYADSLIRFRGSLLNALRGCDFQVVACAPGASRTIRQQLQAMGVEYRDVRLARSGLNPGHDLRTLAQLYRLCIELRPQIVLAYTIKPVIYGSLAARMAGVPTICSMITGLGYAFSGNGFRRRLLGRLVRQLYRTALKGNKRVFFQNPDDLTLFEQLSLVASEQAVLTNGSGVDIDTYYSAPLPSKVSFLMMARLIKEKGIREYVEAARKIKRLHPGVMFHLAGSLDENPASISQDELDVWIEEGVIDYLGQLEDVRPAIRRSAVYVLPSYYREGTPRSVLEAMAMGRPIITTDSPGCRETVIEGQNGFLVPPRDSDALTAAMRRFLDDPALCEAAGQRSRQIAIQKYDVHKVNHVLLDAMGLNDTSVPQVLLS